MTPDDAPEVTGDATSLDDFRPPYELGAFGAALVGTWDAGPEPALAHDGFEPLRWLGRAVGAALVLRYDRPPPAHPVPYSEVILAHVVRRGLELAVMPFDLVLDDAFFVEAGVRHYHLPKRLDPSLSVEVARDASGRPTAMTASASDLAFAMRLDPVAVPGVSPLVAALVRASTACVPVLGVVRHPTLRATIRVAPDARPAYAGREATLTSSRWRLRTLAAFYWPSLAVTVGVPAPVAR